MTKIMFTGDRNQNQAIIDDITENVTGQRPHVSENLVISHAIDGQRIRIVAKLTALLGKDGKNEDRDDYKFFNLSLPLDSEVDVDADIIRPLIQGIGEYDTDGR